MELNKIKHFKKIVFETQVLDAYKTTAKKS